MDRRATRPLLLAALLVVAWLLSHTVYPELDVVWLSLVPAFLLALPLVAGRYVGEQRIAKLVAARHPHVRRGLAAVRPVRFRAAADRIDGGLLLARRLAGRAPPLTTLAA
jgi:hypothetical protein